MERTKSNFRALREMVGMSQGHLAMACGIDSRNVRRWEDPKERGCQPRDFAWDVLEDARKAQLAAYDAAITAVEDASDDAGHALKSVRLTYWPDAITYAHAHPTEDPAGWQMANATARLAGHMLEEMGYEVEFGFPGLNEIANRD